MGGLATRADEQQEMPACRSATGGQNHLRAMKKNGITGKRRERADLGGKKRYTVGMMTERVGRGEEGRWKEGSVMSPHMSDFTRLNSPGHI